MDTISKKILTKREVADMLRIKSTTTLDKMIRKGLFIKPLHRGQRLVGFYEHEVMSWLEENRK